MSRLENEFDSCMRPDYDRNEEVVCAQPLSLPFFCAFRLPCSPRTPPQFTAETDHYRIFSEVSQAQADDVSHRMEAALALYNDIFHFDLTQLPAKFRIRIFKDLDSFNAYLTKVLSQTRTDFVFIAWSDPERSELLCFPKDDAAFTASLLHQGCIQFIKGFVDNPPVWLREGVATYLDASTWDPASSTFTFKPNLAWLDGLKAMVRGETPAKLIDFPRPAHHQQGQRPVTDGRLRPGILGPGAVPPEQPGPQLQPRPLGHRCRPRSEGDAGRQLAALPQESLLLGHRPEAAGGFQRVRPFAEDGDRPREGRH